MLRPDLSGVFAGHSGGAGSEARCLPHFPHAARHLRDYDGGIFRWWDGFRSRVSLRARRRSPAPAWPAARLTP
ncbi:hypothetical protein AGRA3207_000341 [Actinomadura graeca]|uniref:Uncharacterized protein n=1 Tax=Actinomadura graeca TaxID=2750812 RepID=A0ABX8QMH1_9ACTN|nr:hypothetical protein [Actinomadura graeca]QXJ19756.1 hypothetical protein AGRA3207_000341 [Actinomadura graeca]